MKSNVLLQGDIGTGKTRSLMTLLPEYVSEDGEVRRGAGQDVFLLSLEPGAEATLGFNLCAPTSEASFASRKARVHLHYIAPLALSWDEYIDYMRVLNTMDLDNALKVGDRNKRRCTQLLELLAACQDFVCDRCGQSFGDAGSWDEDRTLALDGLTGLTTIARHLCVGLKPILSRPEYNPIMEAIENFLRLFFGGTKCNTVLLSHLDRESDALTGASVLVMSTIGQKLAPRIAKMPDEIITATMEDNDYSWNTALPGQIVKTRRLPRALGLAPDFSQLFR